MLREMCFNDKEKCLLELGLDATTEAIVKRAQSEMIYSSCSQPGVPVPQGIFLLLPRVMRKDCGIAQLKRR